MTGRPLRIRVVDAFTDQPLSGAPAGVVLLDAFPDDAWLQRVAAEVNHAETAFLHPLREESGGQVPDDADPVGGAPVDGGTSGAAAGGAAGAASGAVRASRGTALSGAAGATGGAAGAISGAAGVTGGAAGAISGAAGATGGAVGATGGAVGAISGAAGATGGAVGAIGGAGWALRWFTPTVEVALCGHATLAAAHVLASLEPAQRDVRFITRSGLLTATAGDDGLITLNFPTAPLTPVAADPALAGALGVAEIVAVHHTGPDTDDLLVEVADEATVRAVTPDLRALTPLSRRGVIVTAVAGAGAGYDFVSRFFGPAVGVDEDPVTGSAHTALAPYWAARLGRTTLTGYQASRRGGFVRVTVRGERTELSGHAVTVIDGTLHA